MSINSYLFSTSGSAYGHGRSILYSLPNFCLSRVNHFGIKTVSPCFPELLIAGTSSKSWQPQIAELSRPAGNMVLEMQHTRGLAERYALATMGPSLCGITTLANPTPPSVFTFSNRNVYDTTINLASTGIPAYIIAHNGTPCDSIELYDLQMQSVIAFLERRTPSVTLRGTTMMCGDFLKRLNFENGIKATAMDTPLGRFHWRDHERYGVALCWADDVSMSFPVAYGQPSEEELGLVITSCGMPVVDYILASFILLHLDKYTSR